MNQYKSCSALKSDAREVLTGKYGSFILMMFILYSVTFAIEMALSMFVAVPVAFNVITGSGSDSASLTLSIVQLLLNACLTILIGTSRAGLALFCLNASCGRRASVSDLFYAFRGNFKKCLALSAALLLPETVLLLPCNILQLIYQESGEIHLLLWACVCFLIGICIYVPIEIMLSMSFFLMLDFPQYSAKEILGMSVKITKGHRGRIFYMELSFIPVYLLAILSFGIGMLWVIPYTTMTYARFYLDLMSPGQY